MTERDLSHDLFIASNDLWATDGVHPLAPPLRRFIGKLTDSLLWVLALLPAMSARYGHPWGLAATFGLGAALVLPLGLIQFYLIATTGQSLGKKWCKTRIVRLNGSRPGFVRGVLLRELLCWAVGAVPYVGGVFGLVDALCVFREDRRCLHDHFAGTRVVQA